MVLYVCIKYSVYDLILTSSIAVFEAVIRVEQCNW